MIALQDVKRTDLASLQIKIKDEYDSSVIDVVSGILQRMDFSSDDKEAMAQIKFLNFFSKNRNFVDHPLGFLGASAVCMGAQCTIFPKAACGYKIDNVDDNAVVYKSEESGFSEIGVIPREVLYILAEGRALGILNEIGGIGEEVIESIDDGSDSDKTGFEYSGVGIT